MEWVTDMEKLYFGIAILAFGLFAIIGPFEKNDLENTKQTSIKLPDLKLNKFFTILIKLFSQIS